MFNEPGKVESVQLGAMLAFILCIIVNIMLL